MHPQRPRSKQLEALSRRAFQDALPVHWAYRNQPEEDVGIDGEVEIFKEVSHAQEISYVASGELFKVQLKATDEESLSDALAVRIPVGTFHYYERLSLPVLIVRFHAATGRLYARWFHNFAGSPNATQDTITLRLTEDDLVTKDAPAKWLSDMVVVITPHNLEIPHSSWRREYGVVVRNRSSQPRYAVTVEIRLPTDSALTFAPDKLWLTPRFPIDDIFGLSPIILSGTLTATNEPSHLLTIARVDPAVDYQFILSCAQDEEAREGSRVVWLRVGAGSREPPPVMEMVTPEDSPDSEPLSP